MQKRNSKGFTLVELFVVIFVIAVISVLVFTAYRGIQSQAVTASLKADLSNAQTRLGVDIGTYGHYPATEAEANGGKGLVKSSGTVFQYTVNDGEYCLSATSTRDGSSTWHVLSDNGGSIEEGKCLLVFASTLVATTTSTSSIDLSWGLVTGATSYTLQRDINASFTSPVTIATQPNTTFTSSGLSANTTYYFRVNSVIAGDISKWSNTISATSYPSSISTPSAPTVTASTVTTTTIWSWPSVSCQAGTTARYQYRYTITPSGYDSNWVTPNNPTALLIAFTTSTEGQTYIVSVQAQCYVGSVASAWSTAGQSSYYRPMTQATVTLIASPNPVTWGTNTTLTGGGGSGTGTFSYARVSGPCTVNSATVSSTAAGSCIVTATKAADANYNARTSSEYTITLNFQLPGPPTGLAISIYSETALQLSWSAPVGGISPTGYKIERKTTDSYSTIVENTGNTSTAYTNTLLEANTQYTYRVSGVSSEGSGVASAEVAKYSGDCYPTSGAAPSGYTTILGGEQSGCADVGPVNSPYAGSPTNRYSIVCNYSNACATYGVGGDHTRIARLSIDSGASYADVGSSVVCIDKVDNYYYGVVCGNCGGVSVWGYIWDGTCIPLLSTIRWVCRN